MSNNFQVLGHIIQIKDKSDDLLVQKIRAKEKSFENKDDKKNFQKKEKKRSINIQQDLKVVNKKIKGNRDNSKNRILNININKFDKINKKEKKDSIFNDDKKNNNNNSFINFNINQNNKANKIIDKKNFFKTENKNFLNNQITAKEKRKNNFKKVNNYNYVKGKQQNKNRLENLNNKSNKLNDHTDLKSYTQYISLYSSNNKKLNKSIELRKKNHYETNISESQNKSRDKSFDKNGEKFKLLYDRFLENEKKKQTSIRRLKEEKEEEEKKLCIFQPKINKKSKELASKSKENIKDFYIRQKQLLEQYKKNEELLRERVMQEKDDKIKNSIFPKKNNQNKDRKNDIYKNIKSRLFDWEEKQKQVINNSSNEDNLDKEESISEKSKIIIRVKRKINGIINRLYKNDIKKRKQNLEILNQVYAPSFEPILFENYKKTNKMKRLRIDDKMENNYRSTNYITSNISLDDKIEKEEIKNFERNNITNLLRNKLFNKVKKQERYRSAMNFKVINDENIYEIKDEKTSSNILSTHLINFSSQNK